MQAKALPGLCASVKANVQNGRLGSQWQGQEVKQKQGLVEAGRISFKEEANYWRALEQREGPSYSLTKKKKKKIDNHSRGSIEDGQQGARDARISGMRFVLGN